MSSQLLATSIRPGSGRLLVGVAMAACSAILYDTGYILEKQALDVLPAVRAHPMSVIRTGLTSKRWLTGFLAMLGGLGLQVIALTLAPLSVVQPILAGGLIGLVAIGGTVLKERLQRRQVAALLLILVAVITVAASARGGERVASGVRTGSYAGVIAALGLVGAVTAWYGTRSSSTSHVHRALVATAAGAGVLYGLGAISEKAVAATLVSHGVLGGAGRSLLSVYPWLFLIATFAGLLVFQVGLQRHPASMMAAFTNVVSSVCALVGASVVFGESLLPGGWWSFARVAGFASVLAAVALLALSPGQAAITAPAVNPVRT